MKARKYASRAYTMSFFLYLCCLRFDTTGHFYPCRVPTLVVAVFNLSGGVKTLTKRRTVFALVGQNPSKIEIHIFIAKTNFMFAGLPYFPLCHTFCLGLELSLNYTFGVLLIG